MFKNTLIPILMILLHINVGAQDIQKYTISGQVTDGSTGEDLISANVSSIASNAGTSSNFYGFYSLTLPAGEHTITYSYLGYQDQEVAIDLTADTLLTIELTPQGNMINEVIVSATKEEEEEHVTSTEMSAVKVDIATVKKLPALFGEIDIIKTIQLLPGVKSVGEGSSGFYVRGGNADQNLVLLDEAPIYNASHVLGFFSAFNPDAIKDMKLYKGAIPAQYGGRLSSVLDIRMKDGNSKKFALAGGIGTIMSRLALEAPISDKGSIMVAGRRSYIDVMAKTYDKIKNDDTNDDSEFYFYDLNAKANYRFNDKSRLYLSGYFGRDVLGFDDEDIGFGIEWGNTTATARWNYLFSPKIFSNLTYYFSNYDYFLDFEEDITRFKWDSRLREHSLKADFGAYVNPQNTVEFGMHIIQHAINPGNIESIESGSFVQQFNIQANKSYESALYINNEQKVSESFQVNYGLRLSSLHNAGPQKVLNLDENYEVVDTTNHTSGVYNSYWNLEPRLSMRYQLSPSSSVKASYNRTAQYIQLASNGNSATPFDIWFSSNEQVKPQLADQVAIGYFRNVRNNSIELSAEIYYKRFKNAVDFKDHASLLLNDNLDAELRIGKARAYGLELLAKKTTGALTGWVSYTYSKIEKNIATINNGNWYNAKYDKPHDLSVVVAYELNDRWSMGSNFVYSTGNAVTFPTGRYYFNGVAVPVYSERNDARLPDYHRLDFSATYRTKGKVNRRFQSEWVFSVYNAYNRKNAFSIDFKQEESNANVTYAEKTAVFSIVPAITYNLKF